MLIRLFYKMVIPIDDIAYLCHYRPALLLTFVRQCFVFFLLILIFSLWPCPNTSHEIYVSEFARENFAHIRATFADTFDYCSRLSMNFLLHSYNNIVLVLIFLLLPE
jgi:hypothetical protein